MLGEIKIHSTSTVSMIDLADAISRLSSFEITDLFLQIAERMDDPDDIKKCADMLAKNCFIRFGR